VYLKKIRIKRVKCFDEFELDFVQSDEVRLWTAILGRNGLGKSTLLQIIGTVLMGNVATRELVPVVESWLRQGAKWGSFTAEIDWEQPNHPQTSVDVGYVVTGADGNLFEEIGVNLPARELVYLLGSPEHALADGTNNGWLACGYGPFRRLSGGTEETARILNSGRRSACFVTLFREGAALTNAADWLVELYNTARDGDEHNARALEHVRRAFAEQFFPTPVELKVNAKDALLVLPGREPMRFEQLSDGYRSMLALGVDLLRWLIAAFPDAENPTECPGVMLIDELDAHLHPTWQREIGLWLRAKFPKIQFIVATHSPFLAQVADEGGNIVLEEVDGAVRARPEAESVHAWRADQILTELFQLPNTYAPDVSRKLERFYALHVKQHSGTLSPEETQEYQQLCSWYDTIPPPLEQPEQRLLSETLERAVAKVSDEIKKLL
jgi:hypothetical protein